MDIEQFKYFYFLLYAANPIRDNVKIHIDGDPHMIVMRRDAFVTLIEETVGFSITAAVKETLQTYGTFWLLDKNALTIRKVSLAAAEDPRNIRDMLGISNVDQMRIEASQHADAINPAASLAGATLTSAAFEDPSTVDTSRTKRRGVSLILPK